MKDESAQPSGGLNRRMLLRGGLAAGLGAAAFGVASTALASVPQAGKASRAVRSVSRPEKSGVTLDAFSYDYQVNWEYCGNCAGLWYSGNGTNGVCPAGGGHIDKPSDDYVVEYNVSGATGNPLDPQPEWSWCLKCQGLFYGPNVAESACPDGGDHNRGTWNYSLWYDSSGVYVQQGWWHCSNCQGVFYAGINSTSAGVCPATYEAHDGAGSYTYDMLVYSS
jgi:hypothetical protein